MKKIFLLVLSLMLVFNIFAQQIKKVKIEEVADYIKKSDHPLIINFWATWCAPCVEEIPWFQNIVNTNANNGLELILVSLDFQNNYEKKVTSFAKNNKLNATLFWLDETNADHFCPLIDSAWYGSIPVTLFVNNLAGYRKFYNDQVPENELKNIVAEMMR